MPLNKDRYKAGTSLIGGSPPATVKRGEFDAFEDVLKQAGPLHGPEFERSQAELAELEQRLAGKGHYVRLLLYADLDRPIRTTLHKEPSMSAGRRLRMVGD